jgi:DNA-binding transcriptional LysR family regulator
MLEMQSLGSGEIRIGVGDTILHHLLIPVLQEFINKYPNIKIQINNRTSPGIIDSLKSGTVDLGIVTLPVTDKSIETPEFREVEDVFVASSRFNHLKDRDVSIDELTSLPLLLLKRESSTRRNLDQYFSSKGFSIVPEIELESMELLVELSRIGLGIAHVLKESVEDAIKKGELFILNLADPIPPRKLGIAKLRNVPLSPSADIFASMLLN